MHRLLSKIKPAPNGTRPTTEPRHRSAGSTAGTPAPRVRRSLNEAAHKLSR
jgi:hypothetical protein